MPLVAALLGACGGDEEDAAPTTDEGRPEAEPARVSVKTLEYRYEAPAQFSAGLVAIEVDNSAAQEPREMALSRLEQGKTVADLQQVLAQGILTSPPWLVSAGRPGPIAPGVKATYTANLEPGNHKFVCFIRSADGQPHVYKGMIGSATLVGGQPGSLPEAV